MKGFYTHLLWKPCIVTSRLGTSFPFLCAAIIFHGLDLYSLQNSGARVIGTTVIVLIGFEVDSQVGYLIEYR